MNGRGRRRSVVGLAVVALVACGGGGSAPGRVVQTAAVSTVPTGVATTTASTSPTVTSALTVAPTTTAVTTVATVAPTTTTTSLVPSRPVRYDGFVAFAMGQLQVWNAAGLVLDLQPCRTGCSIDHAVLSARSLWWAETDADGTRVRAADLAGGAPRTVFDRLPGTVADLAVTPDEAGVWVVTSDGTVLRNGGGALEVFDTDVTDVGVSADGRMLAIARRLVSTVDRQLSVELELIAVDLDTGHANTYRRHDDATTAIRGLDWSPSGTRLLFRAEYEGSVALMLDLTTAHSLDDAVTPLPPRSGSACWTADGRVAVGTWLGPYGDDIRAVGDVVLVDPVGGSRASLGVQAFSTGLACFDGDAVAFVDQTPRDPDDPPLTVARPGRAPVVLRASYGVVYAR